MSPKTAPIIVRPTTPADFDGIIELTRATYPGSAPWGISQLQSHLDLFPEGQLVAIDPDDHRVVGMAASLIVLWDDYEFSDNWREFTEQGTFRNHDPEHGHTLYGAEVMVRPGRRGRGIGKALYTARREIAERHGLWRIRAGARLRSYHRYAKHMSAEEYVSKVVAGELKDPTLSFQLREGFHVLGVVANYLANDPESLGYAAVIEWLAQRGTMPAQSAAPGGSAAPNDEITTRVDPPAAAGTTENSVA